VLKLGITWRIIEHIKNNFRSSFYILDGFDKANKSSHAVVPLTTTHEKMKIQKGSVLKVHKLELFYGSDFEFFTISYLVTLKLG
jgi:hypothetical protein